jgi:hypothetical protein
MGDPVYRRGVLTSPKGFMSIEASVNESTGGASSFIATLTSSLPRNSVIFGVFGGIPVVALYGLLEYVGCGTGPGFVIGGLA